MSRKRLTVGELPRLSDSTEHKRPDGTRYYVLNRNPFLYCPHCHGRYSANRSDYWAAAPSTVLRCSDGHLPINMRLVTEERRLVDVSA